MFEISAVAQDKKAAVAAVDSRAGNAEALKMIKPPQARLSNRVVLILDTSHSMVPHVERVIESVMMIADQPLDEFELAVIAFRDTNDFPGGRSYVQWPAPKTKGIPKGWVTLPNPKIIWSIVGWVETLGAHGGTDPRNALLYATRMPRERLSIVLVSDGEFPPAGSLSILRKAQMAREAAGLGPVILVTLGIGKEARFEESLQKLGMLGRGGFWVTEPVKAQGPPKK